jgi:hypothetical protein
VPSAERSNSGSLNWPLPRADCDRTLIAILLATELRTNQTPRLIRNY